MSLVAVSRVAELQSLIQALHAPAAPPHAPADAFAQALGQATAAAPAAAGTTPAAGDPSPFAAEIAAAAARHGVDPALLRGLVRQESEFDPQARSSAGAVGLTQLMPATARELGVTDATDPAQALDGGARYLRQQLDRFGGDESKALAAYNAGPGAVQRYSGVPPFDETRAYVQRVLAFAAEYRDAAAAAPAPVPTLPATGPGQWGIT